MLCAGGGCSSGLAPLGSDLTWPLIWSLALLTHSRTLAASPWAFSSQRGSEPWTLMSPVNHMHMQSCMMSKGG